MHPKIYRDLQKKLNTTGKFNTRRAHLAGYFAKENGKYDEYARAMFKAYFEDNTNIAYRQCRYLFLKVEWRDVNEKCSQ